MCQEVSARARVYTYRYESSEEGGSLAPIRSGPIFPFFFTIHRRVSSIIYFLLYCVSYIVEIIYNNTVYTTL